MTGWERLGIGGLSQAWSFPVTSMLFSVILMR